MRPWSVACWGRGQREQPSLLAELALRPALAGAAPPLRVVDVDGLLEGQADLHAVEPELLLQVFGDVSVIADRGGKGEGRPSAQKGYSSGTKRFLGKIERDPQPANTNLLRIHVRYNPATLHRLMA